MMNVYMNHFGKQVETVNTHTLLIAGSEACAAPGLMSVRISHLLEILLPKGGKGQPIDKDWFDGFLKELTERFGGATSFLRAPGQRRTALPWSKSWWKKSTAATGSPCAKGWSASSPRMRLSFAPKKSGGCDG